MRRAAVYFLLIAALALEVWANVRLAREPIDISPIAATAHPGFSTIEQQQSMLSGQGIDLGSQVVQTFLRPLFHPDRRRFEPKPEFPELQEILPVAELEAPAIAEQGVADLPELTLFGLSSAGVEWKALLGTSDGRLLLWVSAGDEFEGWLVESIASAGVVMVNGTQVAHVGLYPPSTESTNGGDASTY